MNKLTFKKLVEKSNRILIISCQPFDADSICSGTLLRLYLQKIGKKVTQKFPREINQTEREFLSWVPHFDEIVFADTRNDWSDNSQYDTVILVDGRDKIQFYDYKNTNLPAPTFSLHKQIIRIHHHTAPTDEIAKVAIGELKYSSTAEVICRQIIPDKYMDSDMACCAYAGITDDTGNFLWNFTSETLKLASKLYSYGIDAQQIAEKVVHLRDKNFYKNLDFVVKNCNLITNIRTVFLEISIDKQKSNKLSEDDIKQIILAFNTEISKRLKECDRGVLIIEKVDSTYIASRGQSVNKISLPEIFREFGGQGKGHFNAVGYSAKIEFNGLAKKIENKIRCQLK